MPASRSIRNRSMGSNLGRNIRTTRSMTRQTRTVSQMTNRRKKSSGGAGG